MIIINNNDNTIINNPSRAVSTVKGTDKWQMKQLFHDLFYS